MDKNPSTATVTTPPSNFTGDVWMNPVFGGDGTSKLTCGLVRFTPGARTNWHSHVNGQLLVCTDGIGLVGTRDGKTVLTVLVPFIGYPRTLNGLAALNDITGS
jgi:quercetin dioxygenase-like cupin family protein